MGRTEFLTPTIRSGPKVGKRKPSTRAKWRSSTSARSRVRFIVLDMADIVREGCYDSQRLRRTIAMLSRLAIGRETNVLVVGHFRNAIRSQHTRRDQLRHVTVILAMAFSTMAALLGIWTLLHFPGMLLAPASQGHKVVFTGCLLATVGGLGV
jgi:hypothetical protein